MTDEQPSGDNYDLKVADGVMAVFMIFALVCVGLRFLHRVMQRGKKVGWDDWTILTALIFAFGVFITCIVLSLDDIGAAGYRISDIPESEKRPAFYALQILFDVFYTTSISLSKISVILFYYRIFVVQKGLRVFLRVLLFLAVLIWPSGIAFVACSSVSARNPGASLGAAFAALIASILIDMVILATVQFKTWRLKLSIQSRIWLSLLFVLGLFSVIASVLRLYYPARLSLEHRTVSLNDVATIQLWVGIEMFLYIICACLPLVHSFIRQRFKGRRTFNPTKPYKNGLVTIGRISTRPQWNTELNNSGKAFISLDGELQGVEHEILCETAMDGEVVGLRSLDPVQVRREWAVTWEAGESNIDCQPSWEQR